MAPTIDLADLPDLASPGTYHDRVPHDVFDRLRAQPGLIWHPADSGTRTGGFWVVSRYDEVAEVLQSPEVFSSAPGPAFPLANLSGDSPLGKHILFMDPPEHSRVRRAAARSFGPRVIANFEGWVREVVVETLDNALAKQSFDWVAEVARLVPSRVIANVMGVPRDERQVIIDGSKEIFTLQSANDGGEAFANAFMKVGLYLTELGQRKLLDPQDDMVTILAQAHQEGVLDLVEYQLYTASLVVAGFDTTHTMMAHIGMLLAADPAIREQADRAVATGKTDALVDEFVRYVTPAMTFMRTAKENTTFRGQNINKDDSLMLLFTSANRDSAAFANPHTFDPFREGNKPLPSTGGAGLAFSGGPHRCIGHVLARLELRILIEQLYERGVTIELNGEPERGRSLLINQLTALPVVTRSK